MVIPEELCTENLFTSLVEISIFTVCGTGVVI